MGILNAFRIRIIVLILVLFILWQIFRNWPSENEYHPVIIRIFSPILKKYFINI